MASLNRDGLKTNFKMMTQLSTGAFHKLYLIDGNDEIEIRDYFLDKTTYNNFLNQYNIDKDYFLYLHNLQEIEINGGEIIHPIYAPNGISSEGKADKTHRHEISDINLLPEILNQKRNLTDYNFRNFNYNVFVNDLVYQDTTTSPPTDKTLSVEMNKRREKTDYNFKNITSDTPIITHDVSYVDEYGYTRSLRQVIEKLTDAIFGQNDILSDLEKIFDLVNTFSGTTPFNWNNYISSINNGLAYGIASFCTAAIAAAVAPLTDTSDTKYFIPANDKYLRKGLSSQVNSLIKSNNNNFISIYPVFNRLCFKDNGIRQIDNESGTISPYSFLSLNPLINYKQALILDNVPLEFHNSAAIHLHSGQAFRIKSGEYYWNDTITSNLSIPKNNFETSLLTINETAAIFHNRITDKTGKRYVLEDEVNLLIPSKFSTTYFLNSEETINDYSKTYKTINNNLIETYPTNYFITDKHIHENIYYNDDYFIDNSIKKIYIPVKEALFFNEEVLNDYSKNIKIDKSLNTFLNEENTYNLKQIRNYNFDENSLSLVNNKKINVNYLNEENTFQTNISKKNNYLNEETQLTINNKKKTNINYFNEENFVYTTNIDNSVDNSIKNYTYINFNEDNNIVNDNRQHITSIVNENNLYTNTVLHKNYQTNINNTQEIINYKKEFYNTFETNESFETQKNVNNNLFLQNNSQVITSSIIQNKPSSFSINETFDIDTSYKLTPIKNSIASLNGRVSLLESKVNQHSLDINGAMVRITQVENDITNLYNQVYVPRYNNFKIQPHTILSGIGGYITNYFRLWRDEVNELIWENTLTTNSNKNIDLIGSGFIRISKAGFYEFKLQMDFMKYGPNSSKQSGTISVDLYVDFIAVENFTFYLPADDYAGHEATFHYMNPNDSIKSVVFKIYHSINNTAAATDPDIDMLLLESNATKITIINH